MAGLIAMISVLTVVGIEMFFATRGAGHMHGSDYDNLAEPEDAPRIHNHPAKRPQHRRQASLRPFQQVPIGEEPRQRDIVLGDMNASSEHLIASHSPLPGSPEHGKNYFDAEEDSEPDLDLDELDPASEGTRRRQSNGFAKSPPRREGHETFSDEEYDPAAEGMSPGLSEQQEQKKMLLQCLLLEAGILFHSVFIGMALSVATGTPFIVLLVAISFHQTFEGLALGSRIAAVTAFGPTSAKPWLMALAYGTTTPIGQAIGLLVHNMYDPASQTGLLMVGVMNAISSGLLLFAGLVELLAEDFLSDKSYEDLVGRKRVEACGAVVGGSLLMAIVGAWA
ncbi:MAG: hypothetical protein M1819_001851 [Sarea resinae]|nr:MAG: hypothetical protein M1819_001851 [Sarea resinae]